MPIMRKMNLLNVISVHVYKIHATTIPFVSFKYPVTRAQDASTGKLKFVLSVL